MVKNFVIAACLAFICNVMVFNWLFNDNATVHQDEEYAKAGIEHLAIEYLDDSVLLNVKLNKPLTCDEILEIMDINDLPLRDKVYVPVCTTITLSSAVITYKEKKSE